MKYGVVSLVLPLICLFRPAWPELAFASPSTKGSSIRVIHADAGSQSPGRRELVGNVLVEREGMRLRADRMVYDPSSGRLEAWGDVKIEDPSFKLTCGHLVLSSADDELAAWGRPTLTQVEVRDGRKSRTVLTGVQVRIFTGEKRVQVLEEVILTRYEEDDGGEERVELRVRCRSLEALSGARRSTFKGGVVLETPSVGASAERALYDQPSSRFYLLGTARAWNYDRSGRRVNLIEGDKIIYFTRKKRTIVIGNVTADVEPDVKTGERVLPLGNSPLGASPAAMSPLGGSR